MRFDRLRERVTTVREASPDHSQAHDAPASSSHSTRHEASAERPVEIEEGVWAFSLPLPFALRQVNVYLISDGAGHLTLVDAGLGLPRDEAALRVGMASVGVAPEALDAIVLTHAHPDHIGLARAFQEASGAPVFMLEREDERMFAVWGESSGPALLAVTRAFAENGMLLEEAQSDPRVSGAAREAFSDEEARRRASFPLPPREAITTLKDGEALTLGRWRYQAIWTPGHSDYHMCLLREDGLFIAGDHILPKITPNIGLYPNSRPDPLYDYDESLVKVRDLPARLTLPGHRAPITDLAARVNELRAHQRERSTAVHGLVAAHADGAVAGNVAAALFGARLRTIDDRRFAMAETLAHLEHLRLRGRVRRERREQLYVYLAERG
jgi:glyoxylase-like metal-dependent hydrolase (beta-lactamase superfamily II)